MVQGNHVSTVGNILAAKGIPKKRIDAQGAKKKK
jgi:translation initiation factor 1 (eIF-1/SUI1)